ncbi:MAG: hypothetical protein JW734_02820 [Candidatus Omnitrophica bacterium]|nr:hypothetical protein [Candidatus Omnitrophota bacterium]
MFWKIIFVLTAAGFAGKLFRPSAIEKIVIMTGLISRNCHEIVMSAAKKIAICTRPVIYTSRRFREIASRLIYFTYKKPKQIIVERKKKHLLKYLDFQYQRLKYFLRLPDQTKNQLNKWYIDFVKSLNRYHLSENEIREKLKKLQSITTPDGLIDELLIWDSEIRFKTHTESI